jgi:bifunctional ADP-heptose synthase (sugar kinase/adenylyltransferase)
MYDEPSPVGLIGEVRPDVYAKGPDYANRRDGNFALERQAVEAGGGRVVFTTGSTESSSRVLNGYGDNPAVTSPLVQRLRTSLGVDGVMGWIEKTRGLRAAVVGDAILDRYVYVRPTAKAPKDNIVTYVVDGPAEEWRGGSLVIGKHLDGLGMLQVLTVETRPTLKVRGVDRSFNQKVFSYVVPGQDGLMDFAPDDADLVIIGDFGHGAFPDQAEAAAFLAKVPPGCFVALTVQANSLNWGFNLVTKWPRADLIVLDEAEVRLACQDNKSDIKNLAHQILDRLHAKMMIVTLGHHGSLGITAEADAECSALATRVVDRMGAGDACLAYAAPLAAVGAPLDVVLFVGAVASAIKVGAIGNTPNKFADVQKWIRSMLA